MRHNQAGKDERGLAVGGLTTCRDAVTSQAFAPAERRFVVAALAALPGGGAEALITPTAASCHSERQRGIRYATRAGCCGYGSLTRCGALGIDLLPDKAIAGNLSFRAQRGIRNSQPRARIPRPAGLGMTDRRTAPTCSATSPMTGAARCCRTTNQRAGVRPRTPPKADR